MPIIKGQKSVSSGSGSGSDSGSKQISQNGMNMF